MEIKEKIKLLSKKYAQELEEKVQERVLEMEQDDNSHYLVYQVLEIGDTEGRQIDIYQNKRRLLYANLGKFLQEAVFLCFKEKFPQSAPLIIRHEGTKRKKYEIDILINNEAIEIKWRHATTDGGHLKKEREKLKKVTELGYHPIRITFFQSNREKAKKIQEDLKILYPQSNGEYYIGEDAWEYVEARTGVDLKAILTEIVRENLMK